MQIQTPNKTLTVSSKALPWEGACDYMQSSCRYINANEIRFVVVCNKQSPEPGREYVVTAVQQRGAWETVANNTIN